jgi:D-alanyl-D-alanine carboxypeptidase
VCAGPTLLVRMRSLVRAAHTEPRAGAWRSPILTASSVKLRRVGVFAACVSVLVVVAIVVTLGLWHGSTSPPSLRGTVGRTLDRLVAAGVPGAVVFVRDGSQSFTLARGVADVATGAPMEADTRFRVASITKSFVAAVVLQLVDEGRLSLDERVDTAVPHLLPRADAAITVRELLRHTSGLYDFASDWRWFWPYFHGHPGHYWTPAELLAFSLRHPLSFTPGSKWRYSNTNYVVLGLIVEAVTGQSIKNELEERLFAPLGLHDTTFETGSGDRPALAHGYTLLRSKTLDVTGLSSSAWWAAGAIVSTAGDVARFYRALLRGVILPRRLLAAMESVIPNGEPGGGEGLGIVQTRMVATLGSSFKVGCRAGWGHSGQIDGYLSAALADRHATRQYVILVNEDPAALPPGASAAMEAVANAALC